MRVLLPILLCFNGSLCSFLLPIFLGLSSLLPLLGFILLQPLIVVSSFPPLGGSEQVVRTPGEVESVESVESVELVDRGDLRVVEELSITPCLLTEAWCPHTHHPGYGED